MCRHDNQLYEAMVRYLLDWCVQIQQPTYSSEIKNLKLSNGEQHAIRCSGGCSYENQLPQLSLTILDNRPIRKYMILVFCLFNGHLNASAVVVVQLLNLVLSLNNGGGRIYLILLEIVLTPNLHLERLLASPFIQPNFSTLFYNCL